MGSKCVVVEHTAETIFIYASKTLDAELDKLGRRKRKKGLAKRADPSGTQTCADNPKKADKL